MYILLRYVCRRPDDSNWNFDLTGHKAAIAPHDARAKLGGRKLKASSSNGVSISGGIPAPAVHAGRIVAPSSALEIFLATGGALRQAMAGVRSTGRSRRRDGREQAYRALPAAAALKYRMWQRYQQRSSLRVKAALRIKRSVPAACPAPSALIVACLQRTHAPIDRHGKRRGACWSPPRRCAAAWRRQQDGGRRRRIRLAAPPGRRAIEKQ